MKHHYVPKFLLRGWVLKSSETLPDPPFDNKLEKFDIGGDAVSSDRKGLGEVGYERDLYALTRREIAGLKKQDIETIFMSTLDNDAARVKNKLLTSDNIKLTNSERCQWARFLMSLRVRLPDEVNNIVKEASSVLLESLRGNPFEYRQLENECDPETLEAWVEEKFPGLIQNFGLSELGNYIDNEKVGDKLINMHWRVVTFKWGAPELLLSDNPCIWSGGIGDENLIIVLPISPSKLFMACRGESVERKLSALSEKSLIEKVNASSVRQSKKSIFAKTSLPKRFIENRFVKLDKK